MQKFIITLFALVVWVCLGLAAPHSLSPEEFDVKYGNAYRIPADLVPLLIEPARRLHDLKIKEINLRQAALHDAVYLLQTELTRLTTDKASKTLKIVWTITLVGKTYPAHEKVTALTLSAKNISILEVLRFLHSVGVCNYSIHENIVVLDTHTK